MRLKRARDDVRDVVVSEARAAIVARALDPQTKEAAPAKLQNRLVATLAAQAALDDGDGRSAAEAADPPGAWHSALVRNFSWPMQQVSGEQPNASMPSMSQKLL